eukprot:jgi/Chlat1/7731/Chrsp66S07322
MGAAESDGSGGENVPLLVASTSLGAGGGGGGGVVSGAYERSRERSDAQKSAYNFILVATDCFLIGLQACPPLSLWVSLACKEPILVHMSKVEGRFLFNPVSVNFLTEIAKVLFASVMLVGQNRKRLPGERSAFSLSTMLLAAKANALLAVPALLYAINNYLKFVMQLYFKPATVKMLSNLKVLTIAFLLRLVMNRRFNVIQCEALFLLLMGITINQLSCNTALPGADADHLPATMIAYVYTVMSVTVPSAASVYNEYALKSNYEHSVHMQNFLMYAYGAFFNLIGLVIYAIYKGIFEGHTGITLLLICNNAMQGIVSSFFFKFADTILKKYSSTVATILTGLMSAALFGHHLTINFLIGVSIVFISMHQFFGGIESDKSRRTHPEPSPRLHRRSHLKMNGKGSGVDLSSGETATIISDTMSEVELNRRSDASKHPLLPI